MTCFGSTPWPRVRDSSARATRAGVRWSPSRSGSGSRARRIARTCASSSSCIARLRLTDGGRRRKARRRRSNQALTAQILEDRARRRGFVERVEMDPGSAAAQQLGTLPRRPFHADPERGLLVVTHALERGTEGSGNLVAAERRDPLDLRHVRDRHDARDERHADARPPRPLDEREVVGVVVEELGDDDIDSGVYLHLEVPDAELQIPALGVTLGMATAHQAELVAARAHVADHVDGVAKSVRRLTEARVVRPIAAYVDHGLDGARMEQVVMRGELLAACLDG